MFDNENYLNSLFNSKSNTTTEDSTQQSFYFNPQTETQSQTYKSPFDNNDDYTSASNYTTEQTYNTTTSPTFYTEETQEQKTINTIDIPMIEKGKEPVKLIKTQAKIHLETRMKIILSVFSVIVACLMFISIFNFLEVNRIQATFADKELQIKNLEQSISVSNETYNYLVSDEYLENWAATNNYVVKSEGNTVVISLDEMYEEVEQQSVESNWFNDLCEFFGRLFA